MAITTIVLTVSVMSAGYYGCYSTSPKATPTVLVCTKVPTLSNLILHIWCCTAIAKLWCVFFVCIVTIAVAQNLPKLPTLEILCAHYGEVEIHMASNKLKVSQPLALLEWQYGRGCVISSHYLLHGTSFSQASLLESLSSSFRRTQICPAVRAACPGNAGCHREEEEEVEKDGVDGRHGHHGHSNYCFHTPYQNMVLQESARIWWTVELTHHVGQVRDHMDDDNCTGVWRENMMLRGSQRQPRSWLRNKDYWKSLTGHWILLSRRNPHLGTSQARLLLELQRRKDKRSNLFLISSPGSLPQLTASYLCLK